MNPIPAVDSPSVEALVGQIAEEFIQQVNRGEQPDIEEYAGRYPAIAAVLRQVLAALQVIRVPARDLAGDDSAALGAQVTGCLGDFRIFHEIGRGGMGIVYEAEQISLGRRVALKVLPFAAAMDPKQLQRFKNEAQAAAHLQHTNIVPVYYVGCERGVHFYAMQYIEGQTLAAVIAELRQQAGLEKRDPSQPLSDVANELVSGRLAPAKRAASGGPPTMLYVPGQASAAPVGESTPRAGLSTEHSIKSATYLRTIVHLALQAAEALEHAHHEGIVHRDIKPANLLVDVKGNLWITDFGLAHCKSQTGLTMTGDLVGTLRYMSPEQALAKRALIDHRTDIYSLGVTLYEFLTLEAAFPGRDREELLRRIAFEEPQAPRHRNKVIPRELETIVLKMMEKSPEARYATAQELADDLRRFLEDKPIRAKRPSLRLRAVKWARRHQGVVATAIAGLIVAVGILAVSTWSVLSAYRTEAEQRQRAEAERKQAEANLYHSLVGEARALRQARGTGYRGQVLERLRKAMQLGTPEKNLLELRREAVGCMGDFVGLEPVTWDDFPAKISVVALHPQDDEVAIGLDDGRVLLRDVRTGAIKAQLQAHHSRVHALAFEPSGRLLVSAEGDGTIKIWNRDASAAWTYARKLSLAPPRDVFRSFLRHIWVAITPDSKYLAACSEGTSEIAFWSLADGVPATGFSEAGARLRGMALSADGRLLATGFESNNGHGVLVWDVATRKVKKRLFPGFGHVHTVAFSFDGRFLVCTCMGRAVVYETSEFQPHLFNTGISISAAFGPHRDVLAFTCWKLDLVRLCDPLNSQDMAWLSHPGECHSVVFSPTGRILVTADEKSIRIWELPGTREKLVLEGHMGGVYLAFSPDAALLASASVDQSVSIWDTASGHEIKKLGGFRDHVHSVAFSSDGRLLATGDWGGQIRMWAVESWEELDPVEHRLGKEIWNVAFSRTANYFAASGLGGLQIWSLVGSASGERPKLQEIPGPPDKNITSLCFNPAGNLLAWVSRGKQARGGHAVHLWDLQKCAARPTHTSRLAQYYSAIAFYPDGERLAFLNEQDEIEVWDSATDQSAYCYGRGEIKQGSGEVALSADGGLFAVGGTRAVTVWDTEARKLLFALPEEHSFCSYLAWSPSRKFLAVGSADGGIAIWKIPEIQAQLSEMGLGW